MSKEKKIHGKYYAAKTNSNYLRYKWFADRFLSGMSGSRILEIGAGDGGVLQFLNSDNYVCAVDISESAIPFMAEKNIPLSICDISCEALPHETGQFDAVIALEVLEHLKSPQHAIEEIQRVLRPDGLFIASVPNPRTGHKLLYPALFSFGNFRQYLKNNRFDVQLCTTYGICPPLWKRLQPHMSKHYLNQRRNLQGEEGPQVTTYSKLARVLSSKWIERIKPVRYGWSFVYICKNINPTGAESLYREIAEETMGAY